MDVGAVPDDRCGFVYDVSTLPDVGACACWRPTWADESYCVWHTEDGTKPLDAFESVLPRPNERLDGAVLDKVSLDDSDWFEECTLIGAQFSSVNLRDASLVDADLREATLEDVDARRADLSRVNLEDTSVEICDLRNAVLRDAQFDQAVFSNVRIDRGTVFGESVVYEDRLDESTDNDLSRSCAQAAIWAYREIQDLHEDNALAFEARHYYLKEKDIRRRMAWGTEHYGRAIKAEASRWITGYGMNPWRVVATAAVIIVVCAALYPTTGGLQETVSPAGIGGPENITENATANTTVNETGTTTQQDRTITWSIDDPDSTSQYALVLVFFRSLYFSVVTFTTLGYGDISPVGDTARAIAGLEALIGQLLVALLVFVLTRRIS